MRKLLHASRQFFLEPIAPHSLAVMRIALGGTLVILWLRYLPHVDMYFSHQGLALPYIDPMPGSLSMLLTHPPLSVAYALYGLLLIGILGMLLGYGYRAASLLTIVLLVYLGLLSFHNFLASWGRLLFFTTVILGMSGADKTYSLRMYFKNGSWTAWEKVDAWPQRILAIQIAMTYFGVGLQKTFLPDWQSGEILAYAFVNGWSTPLAHTIAQWNMPMWVYDGMTIGVKILHGALPITLWMPRYQKYAFAAGAAFHIGVTVVMGMWWFLLLVPLYAAFVNPQRFVKPGNSRPLHGTGKA
ncbi:hypothetical protein A2881_00830 [Candidatus Peribacteria bacterium RIFCSPHIGHO2_01_FULL_55_13]|nr:MAG: hypothetical protein A2881_00830 [Candidatus Peribacteria bacterium RIFCSPHIGHO2_01_FULL_55_13]OGJ66133.1 MAG: hypothetical protein A3F36_01360 [Candidatus Peribacteria bacterium RIFCSPHIGHO2_12_FULL_55_11]